MPETVRHSSGEKYRFRLEDDLKLHFPRLDFGRHSFRDGFDREWLSLQGHALVVRKGYEWDGSSPKFRIAGYWFGTPDFESTRMASCVHDALYQFINVPCFPVSRKLADEIFCEIMRGNGFRVSGLWFGAVRLFGGLFASDSDPSLACVSRH